MLPRLSRRPPRPAVSGLPVPPPRSVRRPASGSPARACRRYAGAAVHRASDASWYRACRLRGTRHLRRRRLVAPASALPEICPTLCRQSSSWPSSWSSSWSSFSRLAAPRPCAFRCGARVAACRFRALLTCRSSCRAGRPATSSSFSRSPCRRRRTVTSASPRTPAFRAPCALAPASLALSCRSRPARRLHAPASTKALRVPSPLPRACS